MAFLSIIFNIFGVILSEANPVAVIGLIGAIFSCVLAHKYKHIPPSMWPWYSAPLGFGCLVTGVIMIIVGAAS